MTTASSTAISPVTIGSGSDSFSLLLSEDAYLGNAQFTIAIDGVQIGGIQTIAAALHDLDESQMFTVNGEFGTGPHIVSVDFVNDAWGGTAATDRNLYVTAITYKGVTVTPDASLHTNGTQYFQISGNGAVYTPPAVTVGNGPNSLVVNVAEDAWQGNAEFTVSVDGAEIGGVQTTTALKTIGEMQSFTIDGDFGPGNHTVSVDFLNDAWGGSASTDRNLYVQSLTYDGTTVSENAALKTSGAQTFQVLGEAPPPVTIGIGADSMVLTLAEDAWGGDAEFTISVDGTEIGGVLTTIASHNAGQTQSFTVDGTFGSGPHTVAVDFINDAWGGTASMDRNLYVDSISYDGNTLTEDASLHTNGTRDYAVPAAPPPMVTLVSQSLTANLTETLPVAPAPTSTNSTPGVLSMALAGDVTVPVPTETVAGGTFTVGVNLSGMEYNGGGSARPYYDYGIPSQSELAYYQSQGNDLIRLPISWETLQPALGGALNQTYLSEIEGVVNNAVALGMKVIIDMHDYGGYGAEKLGDGTLTDGEFAGVWQQLATTFAGNSGIAGYDLMNEPNGMPSANAWPDAAQAAINAIRTVDKSTAIYVEGDGWSSAGSWAENNPTLASLKDPSSNLIFSAHVYLDTDNSGTHYDWADQAAAGDTTNIGVERLSDFVGWLQANNLKGDIGEIGAGNDSAEWLASLDNTLAYAKANNLQVTYWAGGPWLGDYPLSVEPSDDGVAAPQMAVLDKYTGAVATVTSAALTGSGVANSTIYLSEDGTLLATTTVNASGTWNYTLSGLANGVHTIVAGDTPPAQDGTISALSFDLEAPTPATTVSSYAVKLTGTVSSSSVAVEIFDGKTDLGAATVLATGTWTYSGTLDTANHALSAVATDAGGNHSTTALTTILSGTSGNDALSTSGGNNLLSGNGGGDVYKVNAADTLDTIVNGLSTGNAASGALDMGVASNQLWFVHSGNNLVVDVLGSAQQVTLQNWYANTAMPWEQLAKIVGDDGLATDTAIQNLVQAMASFSTANSAFNPQTTTHVTTSDSYFGTALQTIVAASWHH